MTALYAAFTTPPHDAGADVARMSAALERYGSARPLTSAGGDDLTVWAIGKRLMPMLPEDDYADGLEETTDRRWMVAADVRLSERDALAHQLALGDLADRLSDSALVAHAVARWGEAAFARIYGVFALIALDRSTGRVLLARDFSGDRPLQFHHAAGGLWVASMPEGLLALPHVPRAPEPSSYAGFMCDANVESAATPYAGIERVLPGHYAVFDPATGNVTQHRHWQPDVSPLRLPQQEDYEAVVGRALDAAVAAALRGGGAEIGAHLSSGFDSTAVVTTAARQLAEQGRRLTAFTAVPRKGPLPPLAAHRIADESVLAAHTAAMHDNVDHVIVSPEHGPLGRLDRARHLYGVPVRNLCNLPWIEAINDRARDHCISMMLTGQRGNASLSESGTQALPDLLRAGKLRLWWKTGRALVRGGWMRWRGVVWNSVEPMLPEPVWRRVETMMGRPPIATRRYSMLREPAFAAAQLAAASQYEREGLQDSVSNRLAIMTIADMGCLNKADLATWGIDMRDPTADRRLCELALRIPVERLVWNGEPRAILRKVLADRAPPEVLNTRLRGYQSADWVQALHGDRQALSAEVESIGRYEPAARMIDVERLCKLLETMPEPGSSAWGDEGVEADYRYAMLRSISAASHMRAVAGSNA